MSSPISTLLTPTQTSNLDHPNHQDQHLKRIHNRGGTVSPSNLHFTSLSMHQIVSLHICRKWRTNTQRIKDFFSRFFFARLRTHGFFEVTFLWQNLSRGQKTEHSESQRMTFLVFISKSIAFQSQTLYTWIKGISLVEDFFLSDFWEFFNFSKNRADARRNRSEISIFCKFNNFLKSRPNTFML